MRTFFDGEVHVSYRQVYVNSVVEFPEQTMPDAFVGQVNGLCGGAVPGFLFMTTGLHTGHVGFTVERHDHRPRADDAWEESSKLPPGRDRQAVSRADASTGRHRVNAAPVDPSRICAHRRGIGRRPRRGAWSGPSASLLAAPST